MTEIIFAVLFVSLMGLTRCYKTTVFLHLYNNKTRSESLQQQFREMRQNYSGLQLRDELSLDTELISTIIAHVG